MAVPGAEDFRVESIRHCQRHQEARSQRVRWDTPVMVCIRGINHKTGWCTPAGVEVT
jgi:hypothetical protein